LPGVGPGTIKSKKFSQEDEGTIQEIAGEDVASIDGA